ncbi:MAG: HEPN domain-containing protein [Nitrospirae bacterium]|nr:HEPN domain-containing protein [Nitrospirota bacterium]
MPDPDALLEIVGAWVQKAENDLKNATLTLKFEDDCPTDTVCFHVQQCVEKYLKAFLTHRGIDFPKVHDLKRIVALLPPELAIPLSPGDQDRLTEYATVMRYPGDYEPIGLKEARRAVRTARHVRKIIRGKLPKEALTRRRAKA